MTQALHLRERLRGKSGRGEKATTKLAYTDRHRLHGHSNTSKVRLGEEPVDELGDEWIRRRQLSGDRNVVGAV